MNSPPVVLLPMSQAWNHSLADMIHIATRALENDSRVSEVTA